MKLFKRVVVLCLVLALCVGVAAPAMALDTNQAGSYLDQLYQGLLGRAADEAGKAHFTSLMLNNGVKGSAVAEAIASSPEFRARELSDEEFVECMYVGLLGRASDANGKATFVGYLSNGYSRTWVFKQFASSVEFASKCLSYGVIAGDVNTTATSPNMSQTSVSSTKAADFVKRLYDYLLNRTSTDAERKPWVDKLTGRKMSAAGVAAAIGSSTEFNNRSLTNGEFVQAVYMALLGRSVDTSGWTTFMTALANGKSRSWVFTNICASTEFKNIAAGMNAAAGTVSTNTPIGGNSVNAVKSGEFVKRAYVNLLGRDPSAAETASWVKILTDRKMSAAGVAASIASSAEARKRDMTRDQFVTNAYFTLLKRAPDTEGKETFTNALIKGYSRSWVFTKICASAEFQNSSEFDDMNVVPGYLNSAAYNMG